MNIRQLVSVPVEFRLIVLAAACCLSLVVLTDAGSRLAAQQTVLWSPPVQNSVPQFQDPQWQVPLGQAAQLPLVQTLALGPQIVQPQPPNSVIGSLAWESPIAPVGESTEPPLGAPSSTQPTHRAIESEQIADEISSIRRQLGGGLSKQFSEITKYWRTEAQAQGNASHSEWDGLVKKGFRDEVRRLANDRASHDQANQVAQAPESPQTKFRDVRQSLSQRPQGAILDRPTMPQGLLGNDAAQAAYIARGFAATKPVPSPAEQLRGAARELDQMASQFETSGLYEQADQVRAQAQRFWLKSRKYPNPRPNWGG